MELTVKEIKFTWDRDPRHAMVLVIRHTVPATGQYRIDYTIKNKAGVVVREGSSGWFRIFRDQNESTESTWTCPIEPRLRSGVVYNVKVKVLLKSSTTLMKELSI